jgi:hypothetical protein
VKDEKKNEHEKNNENLDESLKSRLIFKLVTCKILHRVKSRNSIHNQFNVKGSNKKNI